MCRLLVSHIHNVAIACRGLLRLWTSGPAHTNFRIYIAILLYSHSELKIMDIVICSNNNLITSPNSQRL